MIFCSNTGWCEFVHLFVYFNNNPCFISPRTHVVNERERKKNAKVQENDSFAHSFCSNPNSHLLVGRVPLVAHRVCKSIVGTRNIVDLFNSDEKNTVYSGCIDTIIPPLPSLARNISRCARSTLM